ncbi:DNA polymerase subunit gamma-2, mitochondrial [Drosophila guanche]|uniref:Blast:Glutamyl-tRNA(Gln) amidotransferase subunit C, mitochondrial n=1 Tax=Drosophila guanche TaxID=7266 RepID=A0A3B0JJJ3_DROGU|nr:DNA polymerase subunit gamma-2, mitochondrial [Drosophila guanche]SPP82534.1 blast:Glutamyl-tRNA(Gln) amidotransferase subunit C%2C mitochondrial [Drosophila guanche]
MSRLGRCFRSLESAGFLRVLDDSRVELLEHGHAYAELLKQQWLSLRPLAAHLGNSDSTEASVSSTHLRRFAFASSKGFQSNFEQLVREHPRKAKCPTLLKHLCTSSACLPNPFFSHKPPVTHLITDFLVEPYRALEHFYNMQRESKIWWMRYSSNPSRYRIVARELPAEVDAKDCQAIDIMSCYGEECSVAVEQLSLVKLHGDDFRLPDARTGQTLPPAVIRSVIELETATCALLVDGCDHARETQSLLLNRVLAPYQCGIACQEVDGEMADLCLHIKDVLLRAGLRLCQGDGYALTEDASQLREHIKKSDKMGVPYTLLLSEQTLQNGLLQLRNRDTRLAETIHISDLPNYLLNIFKL